MSERVRSFAAWFVMTLCLSAICYVALITCPNELLVDGKHPSADAFRPRNAAPSVGNDLTRVFLPARIELDRQTRTFGRTGRWDPRGFGGRPAVGNPQSSEFYPPAWLLRFTSELAAPAWLTIAHMVWASLGTFLFARALRLGSVASTFAAGCFQASPYVNAHIFEGHYPHVWTAAWYPWILLATLGLTRGSRLGAWIFPPLLALAFLAGHPQEWYYLVVAVAAWAVIDVASSSRTSGRKAASFRLGTWIAVFAVALGMIAFSVIPILETLPWTLKPEGNDARASGRYHIELLNLVQLLSPTALGGPSDYFGPANYWETVVSIGVIPLAFLLVGVRGWRSDRAVSFCAAGAFISLLYAGGSRFGLFSLLRVVLPGTDHFRAPTRVLFLASFRGAILAGKGLASRLSTPPVGRGSRLVRISVISALLACWLLAVISTRPTPAADSSVVRFDDPLGKILVHAARNVARDPLFPPSLSIALFVLLGFGGRASARSSLFMLAAALGLIELGIANARLFVTAPVGEFLERDRLIEDLLRVSSSRSGPFRVRADDGILDDLRASAFGFDKTNINESFQIRSAAELYETLYRMFRPRVTRVEQAMDSVAEDYRTSAAQAVLNRLGAAYLVAPENYPGRAIARGRSRGIGYTIIENPDALPRAYIVPRAAVSDGRAPIPDVLSRIDPREAVLLDRDPFEGASSARQSFIPAEYRVVAPDRIEVLVKTKAPGFLVVSDVWMPGWSAEVDGRASPLLRGDGAHRVVPIRDAGDHVIRMRYEAPGFKTGLLIASAAISLWCLAGTFIYSRERIGMFTLKKNT